MKVVRAIGQAFEVCHKLNVSQNSPKRTGNSESADLVLGNDDTHAGSNSSHSETIADAASAAGTTVRAKRTSTSPSSSSPAIVKGCSCKDERSTEVKEEEDTITVSQGSRVKREEEMMMMTTMKASSTPAIISTCSLKEDQHQQQSAPRGDPDAAMSLLTEASKASASAAAGTEAHLLSSSSRDLSSVSNSLKMIEERIDQLADRIARMEVNQCRLLQILSPEKTATTGSRIDHPIISGTASSLSDYRTSASSADTPVMIQKSVLGLPSSASLPLDCLSFNSIHLFQQSNQHQTSSTANPNATSNGCSNSQSTDHAYQPLYHSILTGYQMSSSTAASGHKPPDSLPLQSPGHDSLISSGQFLVSSMLLIARSSANIDAQQGCREINTQRG